MEKKECCHGSGAFCNVLSVEHCPPKCTFFQTREQFSYGRTFAEIALKEKRLRPCYKIINGKKCVSTEHIPYFEFGEGDGNNDTVADNQQHD